MIVRAESQGDSVSKPRVARHELPWVTSATRPQPQRGCAHRAWSQATAPLGLTLPDPFSQGSSWLATLGWRTLPRWGKPATRTDAERQTLQNAVTATDQQIDALRVAPARPEEVHGLKRRHCQRLPQFCGLAVPADCFL
jgi:hypothetical protein